MKSLSLLLVASALSCVLTNAQVTIPVQCNNPLDPTSDDYGSTVTGYGKWLSSRYPVTTLPSSADILPYDGTIYMPTSSDICEGMAFHWSIVNDRKKIRVAVGVKASAGGGIGLDQGWAAVGFSETGGMKGADIVYFEAATKQLVDAFVADGYFTPRRDSVSQDWTLLHSEITEDGYVIFEAERDLITSRAPGHEDHDLVDDSNIYVADHKIIGAWGGGSFMSFHGNNVVLRSVQLFPGPDGKGGGDEYAIFKAEMAARAEGFADLTLSNYDIPREETTYHEACFTVNKLVDLGLYKNSQADTYAIGFEFLIDPAAVKYLHHMVVYGHFSQWNTSPDRCRDSARTTIALWAPGDDTMHFPDGAGLRIGNVLNSFNAITIQYHYDNASRDTNQVDYGSGVRIYFSGKDSIENEIGMFTLGDANLDLLGESIGNGKTKHEITCPSSCTKNTFDVDEVTVVAEMHHMHAKGKRLVNELFSEDGSAIRNTAAVDYWDFDQSGGLQVRQQPYKLRKGDFYKTTCFYQSYDGTRFGLGSSDEMCMVFVYYYPKDISMFTCSPGDFNSSCSSSHKKTTLGWTNNYGRPVTVAMSPTGAPTKLTESPTMAPIAFPTTEPSALPTEKPTVGPSASPSLSLTASPTMTPSVSPTSNPSASPSLSVTTSPTLTPNAKPTALPSSKPSTSPTMSLTGSPTMGPSISPTMGPTISLSMIPTVEPEPTASPSDVPFGNTHSPTSRPLCVDSPLMFIAQGKSQCCKWVAENPEERCNEMWARGAEAALNIKSHCPMTCGGCDEFGCSDTIGTFILDDGDDDENDLISKDCCWLDSLSEELKKAMCSEHRIQRTCQETCGFCLGDNGLWDEEEME